MRSIAKFQDLKTMTSEEIKDLIIRSLSHLQTREVIQSFNIGEHVEENKEAAEINGGMAVFLRPCYVIRVIINKKINYEQRWVMESINGPSIDLVPEDIKLMQWSKILSDIMTTGLLENIRILNSLMGNKL